MQLINLHRLCSDHKKVIFLLPAVLGIAFFMVGCLPEIGDAGVTQTPVGISILTPSPTIIPNKTGTPPPPRDIPTTTPNPVSLGPTSTTTQSMVVGNSRGYMTTPLELEAVSRMAAQGIEPYKSAVSAVLDWAERDWDYELSENEKCKNSDKPSWNDNQKGTPILYAKALAYHLTSEVRFAEQTKDILETIMTGVKQISLEDPQCRLNLGWGVPELVASADLIEDFWKDKICEGPQSTIYKDTTIVSGQCKILFQNWLVKNPYYVISHSAASSNSNWGAAATNATAYIADYLWDRPQVQLIHRYPKEINEGKEIGRTPAEAYTYANKLALDRMNGYGVEYGSNNSCDFLSGSQQSDQWEPVKSQITESGIIPEDARREEYCNIPQYNGEYQNYPQLHLGNNLQQCELMLRRGDRSCYDNIDHTDIPEYEFVGPDGEVKTTHLYPERGSIERAINAIIVDSNTEWKRNSALAVAYRYYYYNHRFSGFNQWVEHLDSTMDCSQDICFGLLTHGFALGQEPGFPPFVFPP